MKRYPENNIILALFLLLTFTHAIFAQTVPDQTKSQAISEVLSEIVKVDSAPGIIGVIISSNGVLAIGAAGVRKAGTEVKFATTDHVHLGSCTKAMTATMIATLVAESKLSWDSKLVEVIPELNTTIHQDYHEITLWQLLTHRAGIQKNVKNWGAHSRKEIKVRRLAILKDNLKKPASYENGKFNYSNFGYMIAACMAEQVTGYSWEKLMQERLFDPLEMTTAGFGSPGSKKLVDQPWGHEKSWNKWKPSYEDNPPALGPAGRIHCSIQDWAKFLSLQLTDSNPILDKKYLDKLIEPTGFYAAGWGVASEKDQPWGKGTVLMHSGSNAVWYCSIAVAPSLNRAFMVATNSRDFGVTADMCNEVLIDLVKLDRVRTKEDLKHHKNSGVNMTADKILAIGSWSGSIQMGDENPSLIFSIYKDDTNQLAGSLSVPSKGVKELPLSSVTVEEANITFSIAAAQAKFKGKLNLTGHELEGIWHEGESSYQLSLKPLTDKIDYKKEKQLNNSSLKLGLASTHFEFYSKEKDRETLNDLAKKLENNYTEITSHMSTVFEDKIQVYIYPDLATFHKAINYPDAPDWVVGAAGKNELKIVSPFNPGSVHSYESLMQAVVHEFTHTVVLNIREHGAVGLPNWLNEGYAYYEANQLTSAQREAVQTSVAQNNVPIWNKIREANTFQFGEMGGYEISATIVEFLVQTYGYDKLRQFIIKPENADKIYGMSIEELENRWIDYLTKNKDIKT